MPRSSQEHDHPAADTSGAASQTLRLVQRRLTRTQRPPNRRLRNARLPHDIPSRLKLPLRKRMRRLTLRPQIPLQRPLHKPGPRHIPTSRIKLREKLLRNQNVNACAHRPIVAHACDRTRWLQNLRHRPEYINRNSWGIGGPPSPHRGAGVPVSGGGRVPGFGSTPSSARAICTTCRPLERGNTCMA